MRRIITALLLAVCLELFLSNVLMPVSGADFWAAKAAQLLQFGPYEGPGELLARALLPGIIWLAVSRYLAPFRIGFTQNPNPNSPWPASEPAIPSARVGGLDESKCQGPYASEHSPRGRAARRG